MEEACSTIETVCLNLFLTSLIDEIFELLFSLLSQADLSFETADLQKDEFNIWFLNNSMLYFAI